MPTPIYTVSTRGSSLGGNIHCTDQAEAQKLYDSLVDGVNSGSEFIELELGESKTTVRVSHIHGFSISVHMEETAEEIKQRRIAQIEQGAGDYYGNAVECSPKNYIGSGLI